MSGLTTWKIVLYSVLCACADGLDSIFLVFTTRVEDSDAPSCIKGMSDEEILSMKRTHVDPDSHFCCTYWLGDSLVGKKVGQFRSFVDCYEANAINIVRSRTKIPAPQIRRVVRVNELGFFLVMDRVKGDQLSEVWNTLSIWRKISVAFLLRRYIIQLRRFTRPSPDAPPGPVSAFGAQDCDNPRIFGLMYPRRGPFETHQDLIAYCNKYYRIALERSVKRGQKIGPVDQPGFDDSDPLVLCHQDLTPRNMILGEDGRLWLIDWGEAGYYPPWFEQPGMLNAASHERVELEKDHKHWDLIVPFVCGRYYEQTRRWLELQWTFSRTDHWWSKSKSY